LNADDAGGNTYSWVRSDSEGQQIAVIVNFSSEPWTHYRLGLPNAGVWKEIFNSDAGIYDGSNTHGNLGQVVASDEGWNGYPASANVVVPPLGAVYFRYVAEE
ncbi:MAG: alpha amylase C-terminal domain-containing protein, partial [Propionicimonas sp.]